MSAHVVVVGGGPAGLAAAGALARRDFEVTVLEAGRYPRARLCGEFLSPDAGAALTALGLPDLAARLDAPPIEHVRVTASSGGRVRAALGAALPQPGHGISRLDLDALLARAARSAGARVRECSRVLRVAEDGDRIAVTTAAERLHAAAVVVATGRLARPAGVSDTERRERRWVAVKVHVHGLRLPAVTELHFVRGAYVGLNAVTCDGERRVNVCALARQGLVEDIVGGAACPVALLAALASRSPAFAARWRVARPVAGTQLAAAGFTFERRGARAAAGARPALVCGDAAALVAPLVGDGQAMALTTGVAAAHCLAAARDVGGALSASAVASAVRAHDRRYRDEMCLRLRAGGLLQAVLLRPLGAVALLRGAAAARSVPHRIYRVTRGPFRDRSGACAARSS